MIELRRIHPIDLEIIFDWRNDPRIYKWCRQNAPLHWDDHLAWFEWQRKDPRTEMFKIKVTDWGFVGVCGLTSIDRVNGHAEFSLYINPDDQGRGFAKEALIELFRFGFNVLRLNRIWGESFEGNPAMKLFEKLGMEKEGVRREYYFRDGRYIDATLFSIGATDFNNLQERDSSKRGLKPVA